MLSNYKCAPRRVFQTLIPAQVGRENLAALCQVSRTLLRITSPLLWEHVDLNFASPKGRKLPLDDSKRQTKRNKDIIGNIVRWTKELRFLIRGDQHPERLYTAHTLIKALGESRNLEVLDMSGSQLDLRCWQALDSILNGPLRSSIRETIAKLLMPTLTERECRQRVNHALHNPSRDSLRGDSFLDVSPGNFNLEWDCHAVGDRRTISITAYGTAWKTGMKGRLE
jgi:hypothetical protein